MRAYIVQYVSLMLILLTFVIGCFAARPPAASKPVEPSKPEVREEEPVAAREFLTSQLELGTLFTGDTIDPDKLAALGQFLSNHDIDADLEIHAPSLLLGIAESRLLAERLTADGIPPDIYRISIALSDSPGLLARLFRHREGGQ